MRYENITQYAVLFIVVFFPLFAGAQEMQTPKQDAEVLLKASTGLADKMLREYGEFYPYGVAMEMDGKIADVAGYTGSEHPPSQEIIELLKSAFIADAKQGKYKAVAIVFDTKVTIAKDGKKSDAVAVAIDHKDNYSVIVFYPYTIQNGMVNYDKNFATKGDNSIFNNAGVTK